MLLLNGNVLDAFARFIDRMTAVIAISVRRLFHRNNILFISLFINYKYTYLYLAKDWGFW